MTAELSRRDALLRTMALAGAGLLPGAPVAGLAAIQPHRTVIGTIDAGLNAGISPSGVPGVVAMAATAQSVIYEGTFGLRNRNMPEKMSTDTIFRIASMVKLLTSVAAMQLVERDKLDLDAPAESIDPALADALVLTGFDAKDVPQLRKPKKPFTLRNLLTHTSGFSYPLWDANVLHYFHCKHGNKLLPRRPLAFDPDTRWAYGGSLDTVGRMVEMVSGQPLDRYFHDHITGPLGMVDTGFNITEKQQAREANLHTRKADGTLVPQPREKPIVATSFSGGGGIYSTAPDYLKLLQALLNGGRLDGADILKPKTVALMSQNQIGDIQAGIMKTTNPALSNDVDFFPGNRLRWGLGHMINLDPVPEARRAGSLTWAGLYNTYYWLDPASGVAGVIMMQILPFADHRALAVYRAFERNIYKAIKQA
jgi:CubicO group peptidase (beta-lactamase class C family)